MFISSSFNSYNQRDRLTQPNTGSNASKAAEDGSLFQMRGGLYSLGYTTEYAVEKNKKKLNVQQKKKSWVSYFLKVW